eukprot:scaffold60563_cov51-Phaeocystis_antarctica.AAC.1
MLMTLPWSRHRLHCTPAAHNGGGPEEVQRWRRAEAAAGERPVTTAAAAHASRRLRPVPRGGLLRRAEAGPPLATGGAYSS